MNMTKPGGNCGFGYIYNEEILNGKLHVLCGVLGDKIVAKIVCNVVQI